MSKNLLQRLKEIQAQTPHSVIFIKQWKTAHNVCTDTFSFRDKCHG
jgi:hypothetical protein